MLSSSGGWITQKVFCKIGSYSPAFGMVDTLIGLVQMMHNLNNP